MAASSLATWENEGLEAEEKQALSEPGQLQGWVQQIEVTGICSVRSMVMHENTAQQRKAAMPCAPSPGMALPKRAGSDTQQPLHCNLPKRLTGAYLYLLVMAPPTNLLSGAAAQQRCIKPRYPGGKRSPWGSPSRSPCAIAAGQLNLL